jgi:two-component system, cell cycle response regulator
VRVLVAEDDPITRKLLQVHLTKWGHEVVVCADGAEAWDVLSRDDSPKLAVLDWMMPGMDGVTICREIRSQERQSYIYVILLTAKTRKEDVIEGLEAGADDYIAKPFDAHELKVRVRAGSRIIRLQEDLMSALAASEYQASHDALTGLLNRKAIIELLKKELLRADRQTAPLGVIVADLDHFKRINDSHGHLAGDVVLKEVAAIMLKSVRPYDSAGRYGGEEFLIVCPACDAECARGVAERLRRLLSETPLVSTEGVFNVTMSFGVASVNCEGMDADSIIRMADHALYEAKELGRNAVQLYRDADVGAELIGRDSTT